MPAAACCGSACGRRSPACSPPLGLFLAFSWAGLWLVLPPLARAIGLFVFVVLAAVAALPLIRLRWPSVRDGLRRLDRGSGEAHRPASAIADEIAANQTDPGRAGAVARACRARADVGAQAQGRLAAAEARDARSDGAARAGADPGGGELLCRAAANASKRITAAFDWQGVVAPANFRVDAWVTPPVYTGRPPVMLPGLRPGETAQARGPVAVPVGSQLVVRATGNVHFDIAHQGGLEDAAADAHAVLPAGTEERRFIIKGDGSAAMRGVVGTDLTWSFTAVPDKPPTIALIKEPQRQARGALRLDYKVEDDYGVVGAQATFARKPDAERRQSRRIRCSSRPISR